MQQLLFQQGVLVADLRKMKMQQNSSSRGSRLHKVEVFIDHTFIEFCNSIRWFFVEKSFSQQFFIVVIDYKTINLTLPITGLKTRELVSLFLGYLILVIHFSNLKKLNKASKFIIKTKPFKRVHQLRALDTNNNKNLIFLSISFVNGI